MKWNVSVSSYTTQKPARWLIVSSQLCTPFRKTGHEVYGLSESNNVIISLPEGVYSQWTKE
jgi:hypothetical protein